MMGQEGVAGAGRGSQDICTTNRNCNACELFISIFMSVTLTYSGSLLPNADVCDRPPASPFGEKHSGCFSFRVINIAQTALSGGCIIINHENALSNFQTFQG